MCRNKRKSGNMWKLLAHNYFAVGCEEFCFFSIFLQIDPQTHHHQFWLFFHAINSICSKCREVPTVWIFSALPFEQTWEHLYVIRCVAAFAALLWTSLLLPCSQMDRATAAQDVTKEALCVTFCVPGNNGYASIFVFPGFCWMRWCSGARNKVILVTAC